MKTAVDRPGAAARFITNKSPQELGAGSKLLIYFLFAGICFIVFFPIAVVVLAAFKSNANLIQSSPLSLPDTWRFSNLAAAFERGNLLTGFKNTAVLIAVSVVFNTILGSMTAYVLDRFDFRLKKVVFVLFIMAMVVPFYTTEVARFQIIKQLGLYDTIFAPIAIYAGTDLLQIFIYLQFVEKISRQLDESAMMEGASYFRIYLSIIFPMLLPATATLAIIKSVDIMNDMYIPYLYMPSEELNTVSTALMTFVGERGTNWNELSAAILIVLVPTLILYLAFQKFIFSGITEGALKG